jgi:hypothetical protein
MQKQQNIVGYLNWSINFYLLGRMVGYDLIDPYTNPLRFNMNNIHYANGDGYLFYPAAKYNADEPLPSLRLLAARDGQEDYDMLIALENAYADCAMSYETDSILDNLADYLDNVYDKIYNRTVYYHDDKTFNEVRRVVGAMTDAACGESKTAVTSNVSSNGLYETLKIYSAADAIYVDGKKIEKKNGYYTYVATLKNGGDSVAIAYEVDGVKNFFTYYLEATQYTVDITRLEASGITVSDGSSATIEEGTIKCNVVSGGEGLESLLFTPTINIPLTLDYGKVNDLTLTLKNTCKSDTVITVYLSQGSKLYKVDETILYAYETYEYTIEKILEETNCTFLNEATGICFMFKNVDNRNVKLEDRSFEITGIRYDAGA